MHRRKTLGDAGRPARRSANERATVGSERIAVVEVHDGGAVVHAGAEVDAHLLDDVAPHFGDVDLQHHLVAAADGDGVDDLVSAADQARGEIAGLLGLDRARYRAGQDDAVADAFDLNSRQRPPERGTHAIQIALDRDVIGRDLLAVGIEEHDVGLADRRADDVGALRRAHHGVGDLGIGDQHVLNVARQIDNHGFSDAERQEPCLDRSAGGNRNRVGIGIGRDDRREGRIERQRGNGRERQGANDESPQPQLIAPALTARQTCLKPKSIRELARHSF